MENPDKQPNIPMLIMVALAGWLLPGAGYALLKQYKRAAIIGIAIIATFMIGLYIGSVAVIDPVRAKPWFFAQILNSPIVFYLGKLSVSGSYTVFGKPQEIGQIYTAVAGLLNMLCIINSVHAAYLIDMEFITQEKK